jgi:hypothetical protein
MYKPFDIIKLYLFYNNIFIFYHFYNVNHNSQGLYKLQGYFEFT